MSQKLSGPPSLPTKPPSSRPSPPAPSCLHCTPRKGSPQGGLPRWPGLQAVPGPLVLSKQGHAVNRQAGHRCTGHPEPCLPCANCSWSPSISTPPSPQPAPPAEQNPAWLPSTMALRNSLLEVPGLQHTFTEQLRMFWSHCPSPGSRLRVWKGHHSPGPTSDVAPQHAWQAPTSPQTSLQRLCPLP